MSGRINYNTLLLLVGVVGTIVLLLKEEVDTAVREEQNIIWKHANNLGEPLVYNSSHEFTRSIGIIAKEIIGDHFVLGEPEKKKGFFKKLFGKK